MIPTPVELEHVEWWNDRDEVVAFARWYWSGPNFGVRGQTTEVIDYFEKPWKWTTEYTEWKGESE